MTPINHSDPAYAKKGGVVYVDGVEAFSAPNVGAVVMYFLEVARRMAYTVTTARRVEARGSDGEIMFWFEPAVRAVNPQIEPEIPIGAVAEREIAACPGCDDSATHQPWSAAAPVCASCGCGLIPVGSRGWWFRGSCGKVHGYTNDRATAERQLDVHEKIAHRLACGVERSVH